MGSGSKHTPLFGSVRKCALRSQRVKKVKLKVVARRKRDREPSRVSCKVLK